MNTAVLKRWRSIALALAPLGFIGFLTAAWLKGGYVLQLFTALFGFGCLSYFLFTEAFLYTSGERSGANVWTARVFFALSVIITGGLLVALSGQ
jgi:hypothetical protein